MTNEDFFLLPFHFTKIYSYSFTQRKFLGLKITLEHILIAATYATKYLTFHYQNIHIGN